ncbi:Fe-S cluster assembly protein SufD [bacterium]|nr:Fe-S cluster assembly protein SufD [bacterium]
MPATTQQLSPVERKLANWQPAADVPDWFAQQRRDARDAYFDSALPDRSDEAWHYGHPQHYTLDDLDIAHAQPGFNGIRYERICGLTGQPRRIACLSMVGDNVAEISSSTPLRDAGVTVMSLRQALALRGDQLQDYWQRELLKADRDRLTASHYALIDNGFYVHVPAGVTAPEPIHLIMETGEQGSVVAPHVIIGAEKGSTSTVFVHYLGSTYEKRNLQLGQLHAHLDDAAKLSVVKVEHVGLNTDILTQELANVGRDAKYVSVAVHFGGKHLRHEAVANHAQPGGSSELLGMHFVRDRQRYDFQTTQVHAAPECASNLLFKGAVMDRGRASYQGIIQVHPHAQKTDAYQTNRTLLLSPEARADSSPQLEILANDVRCSHGSTVANVDKDQIFYLESRGIRAAEARRLIVSGFMAEIADRVPLATARDYVYNYVLDRVNE